MPVPCGENRWQIPLGPSTLPQRIEVLFDGETATASEQPQWEFTAPDLGDLAVQQTLWTISGPPGFETEKPDDAGVADPLRQELIRLEDLTTAVELGSDTPIEEPGEGVRWYLPWARRWVAAWNGANGS